MAVATPAGAATAAPNPVLEFVTPGSTYPVKYTATGGQVTAALAGFDSVVVCSGSHGDGEITGPRSTLSNFAFTGCKAQGGTENGQKCESAGASEEEITAEAIEADLVYISQARREVGVLLNPAGGVYMTFVCGGEEVKASGPFLAPVGPTNVPESSFKATMTRLGATQLPGEYENAIGEKRLAVPIGVRTGKSPATTGVELSFTIQTSATIQIKAITAAEIEARQRAAEGAVAEAERKRQSEDAAAAAAAKKRQEAEAAATAAIRQRQQEEAKSRRIRHKLLTSSLQQCRQQAGSKQQRLRCEKRAKNRFGSQKANKP